MKLFSSLAAAAVIGFLIALFTAQHGCASSCAQNCPATSVYIGSPDDTELSIAFDSYGPACPPRSTVICTGDESTTYCTHTTVTGISSGTCDVLVAFNPYTDGRQDEVIHLQFGQTSSAPGTCCAGYPVVGPSTYIIPDHPNGGGIYATIDGGNHLDADITYVTDGGADATGDAARDGGADAPSNGG